MAYTWLLLTLGATLVLAWILPMAIVSCMLVFFVKKHLLTCSSQRTFLLGVRHDELSSRVCHDRVHLCHDQLTAIPRETRVKYIYYSEVTPHTYPTLRGCFRYGTSILVLILQLLYSSYRLETCSIDNSLALLPSAANRRTS
jgi:hypothetical protein